jgi:hypothetical protein
MTVDAIKGTVTLTYWADRLRVVARRSEDVGDEVGHSRARTPHKAPDH